MIGQVRSYFRIEKISKLMDNGDISKLKTQIGRGTEQIGMPIWILYPFHMPCLPRKRGMEKSGREGIHREIGRTDFDPPAVVKEAAKKPWMPDKYITPLPFGSSS